MHAQYEIFPRENFLFRWKQSRRSQRGRSPRSTDKRAEAVLGSCIVVSDGRSDPTRGLEGGLDFPELPLW